KRPIFGALLVVMAALSLHDLVGMAQGRVTPPGKFIASAQWKKMLDADKPALGIVAGQAARIVEPFVIRRRLDGPNNASVHTKDGDGQDVTEVYYILEGTGTYTTGGSIPDPKNRTEGLEEINDVTTVAVIVGMIENGRTDPWAGEWHLERITNCGLGAVGHENQSVCEIERFVDVVGDHHDRVARFFPDTQQDVLQLESR